MNRGAGIVIVLGVAGLVAWGASSAFRASSALEATRGGDEPPDAGPAAPETLAVAPARSSAEDGVPAPAGARSVRPARPDRVEGRLLDEGGAPLVGVLVRPNGGSASVATTDTTGRFVLEGVVPPLTEVVVSGGDVAEQTVTLAGFDGTRVPRDASRTIGGTVRDRSSAAPIAGVLVEARPSTSPASAESSRTTTDEAGRFVVAVPSPGSYVLRVGSGYIAEHGGTAADDWVSAAVESVLAGRSDVAVTLERGLSLEGEIVDERGVRVTRIVTVDAVGRTIAGDPDYTTRRIVRVTEGRMRIAGLVAGRYDLWLSPDATTEDAAGAAVSSTVVRDVAAGTQGLTIHLTRGYLMTGVLVDGDGAPVADKGRLYAYREGEGGRNHATIGDVLGDGTFRIGPLDDGFRYEILATDFPGRLATTVRGVAPRDPGGVRIVLAPGGSIRGRVETADGKPVPAGVSVGALAQPFDPVAAGSRVFAFTASDGTFVADGLSGTSFLLEAGGGTSGYLGTPKATLAPGAVDVVLRVTAGASLVGTLVDDRGDPVATTSLQADDGARVAAMRPYAQVGADGRFLLRGLRAGPVRLTAMIGGRWIPLGEVTAPGTDLEVAVPAR